MSRGSHKIEQARFAVWTVSPDKQHRIRISLSEIQSIVPWLNVADGIDCVASPGPAGGVQIEPWTTQESVRKQFDEALSDLVPTSTEAGDSWVDVARLLATNWRLRIGVEESRINVTLPEPVREGLQIPGYGGMVVVFAFGEILEIWDASKWHNHVRGIMAKRELSVGEAIKTIQNR